MADAGRQWWEYMQHTASAYSTPLSITFSNLATHNHFCLDRGGRVFNAHAPIIKLAAAAGEDEHLGLLGLLNCSAACFWMQQIFHNRGRPGAESAGADERWEFRFEFSGTQLEQIPLPSGRPLSLARQIDALATEYSQLLPSAVVKRGTPTAQVLADARKGAEANRRLMIALQEELDWQCYDLYGLTPESLVYAEQVPPLDLGERAFEIILARQVQHGDLETAWFARHASKPSIEPPKHLPENYRRLIERRIQAIDNNNRVGFIERPEFKRRWGMGKPGKGFAESWSEFEKEALQCWLLDRLEGDQYWPNTELQSTARLADRASTDVEFIQVATLYRGRPDFDLAALVAELIESEATPFLPVLRYKATGLLKRAVWERMWDLQRQEDAGKKVGDIPTTNYTSADYQNTEYWHLRGKLDVPKERWISYPHCSTDSDPTLVVGWAGWNHLEQATALIAYYDARKREGWDPKRLTPLLSGLDQLLPWIRQWHPEIDAEFGETAGQSFQTMLEHDAHELGLTLEDIRKWTPPEKAKKASKGRKKKVASGDEE